MTTLYERRPGDGRHLPGADLGERDLRLGRDQGRTGAEAEAKRKGSSGSAPDSGSSLYRRRKPPRNGSRNRRPAPSEAANRKRPERGTGGTKASDPSTRYRRQRGPNRPTPDVRTAPAATRLPTPQGAPKVRRSPAGWALSANRPRDVGAAGEAEAPGALDRLGDADPGTGELSRPPNPARASEASSERVAGQVGTVLARGRRRAPRSACPGPSRGRGRVDPPRRARIASSPAVGSSARISTAAASPSGSATTLRRAWMP